MKYSSVHPLDNFMTNLKAHLKSRPYNHSMSFSKQKKPIQNVTNFRNYQNSINTQQPPRFIAYVLIESLITTPTLLVSSSGPV